MTFEYLKEAQAYVDEHKWEGCICPCCKQICKVYKRSMTADQARVLIMMWKMVGMEPIHTPTAIDNSGSGSKLRYWGLIRGNMELGKGWWQLTQLGRDFLRRNLRVAKWAVIFDGRLLWLDDSETITIDDALGEHFDYDTLMATHADPNDGPDGVLAS